MVSNNSSPLKVSKAVASTAKVLNLLTSGEDLPDAKVSEE
jgi:hypothetical protein